MAQTTHSISVVICAYTERRWQDLVAAIESVQQQTLRPKEIIIVIDYNADLLKRVQEEIPDVVAIGNQEAKGLSGSRNSGAYIAQGDVVAFLDDDAIADSTWIEHLVTYYNAPDVLGVGGKIEPRWPAIRPDWFPEEFYWVVGCTYRGTPTTPAPVRNLIGANMSVRRHILLSVDGFRQAFGCNHTASVQPSPPDRLAWFTHHAGDEETEFCIRVVQRRPNGQWLYTPHALVQHCVSLQRTRMLYFLWRCYDEGLGKASLTELHGTQVGLSSERDYTLKTLPQGIVRGLRDTLLHHDLYGVTRAGAILLGFAATTTGYLIGRTLQWRMLFRNSNMLDSLVEVHTLLPVEKER